MEITNVVLAFFRAESRTAFARGQAGEFESCAFIFDMKQAKKALEGASAGGWIDLVECLILNGAKIRKQALFEACKFGQTEMVQHLLQTKKCFGFDEIEDAVENAVAIAIEQKHIEIVKLECVQPYMRAHANLVIQSLKENRTPEEASMLHRLGRNLNHAFWKAIATEDVATVKDLIRDVDYAEEYFSFACSKGNNLIINEFVTVGYASCEHICRCGDVVALEQFMNQTWNLSNVLLVACDFGNLECVQFLFYNVQHIQAYALQHLHKQGRLEFVQLALQDTLRCFNRKTKLILGFHANLESYELLFNFLRENDRLDLVDMNKSLKKAYKRGNVSVVDLFLNIVDEVSKNMLTLLQNKHEDTREASERIEATKLNVDKCFIQACRYGHLQCAIKMLDRGAKTLMSGINFANANGHSDVALHFLSKISS